MEHNNEIKKTKLTKAGIAALLAPFRWMLMSSIVFFCAAGTIYSNRYWFYIGVNLFCSLIIGVISWKLFPELLNQRGKSQTGTKKWDLFLIIPYLLLIIIVVPLVAGLDAVRFGWSSLEYSYFYIGAVLYIFSSMFILWAMVANRHFEGTVRIQKERKHKVISSGPYKLVRHPGYFGMIINSFSLPFLFGSKFAFIPVVISLLILIVRTYKEDKTLQQELAGYTVFTKKTKYRLLPFVW